VTLKALSPPLATASALAATGARRALTPVVLMLAPSLAVLLSISIYPVFRGIWLSFRNTSLIFQTDAFVGLDNYAAMLADPKFWNAWRNTLVFTVSSTALETVLGLLMALILFETFGGRGWVRASMLIPWAIPTVVTSKMFAWMFDGQNGVVNYLLRTVGLISGNINWYGSADHALLTIIIADVWKTTPFMALLLLSGLQTIPNSLAEAARIDGASEFQYFARIRLPLLAPTLLIAALFRALDAFRIFDLVYVLTGGGPADATEVLSTLTYKTLFSALQFGPGSALSSAIFFTEMLIALCFGIAVTRRMKNTTR
jgi:trehalose/maltose transport system permease protein